jgi:hypothetical protein
LSVAELTADRTVTLPLLTGNDEVVFKDHTQTLTHKTLTSPTLAGTPVLDSTSAVPFYGDSLHRQAIINGNFDVWQRGTSFNANSTNLYTADRWCTYNNTASQAATITQQDGTGVYGSIYCLRYQRTSGQTGTNTMYVRYGLETVDSKKLRNQKLTLSFWARCGANYSASSSNLEVKIISGTGTDQNILSGFTGAANEASENKVLTTSWQKFTLTTSAEIGVTKTQLGISFEFTPTGTAGAADYFEIAQVQLCAGEVALPFMPKSFDEELLACQRYYEKSYDYADAPGTSTDTESVNAHARTAVWMYLTYIPYKVKKRVKSTPVIYSSTGAINKIRDVIASVDFNCGVQNQGQFGFNIYGTNLTVGNELHFHWIIDAEL